VFVKKNIVLCLNMDTVKNKNLNQFNSMEKYGYKYIVVGYEENKVTQYSNGYKYIRYPKRLLSRILFVISVLIEKKKRIHHVELYTGGGAFIGIEYLLLRIFRFKICVVERGSPLKDIEGHYNLVGRSIRKRIYRKANYVWIRELWMVEALSTIGRRDYFFLANAIEVTKEFCFNNFKPIDYIWCNSFKNWRNPEWVVDTLSLTAFKSTKTVMIGLLNNKTVLDTETNILSKQNPNLKILPFQDPKTYMLSSKYFILPADIVYLNFALLEAMSYGVVPIVSDVDGAREIVDDGIDGFIASHSKEGFASCMEKALLQSSSEYETMAEKAREKIIEKFSIESWSHTLNNFYDSIGQL
jgi:glycosyltransferase involved in cell wall biosynthesis